MVRGILGVPIGAPMMGLLKARATPQVARDAVLTGRRVAGEDALAAGLVDELAAEDALLERAKARATELAGKERRIFGTLKRQLNASAIAGFAVEG